MTTNTLKRALRNQGFIYGISFKYEFDSWVWYCKKFTSLTKAETWLKTEENDFRQRILLTESKAIRMFGANFKKGKW